MVSAVVVVQDDFVKLFRGGRTTATADIVIMIHFTCHSRASDVASIAISTWVCISKRRRSSVVEKFRKVSGTVWVSFEAVIIEKTLKED